MRMRPDFPICGGAGKVRRSCVSGLTLAAPLAGKRVTPAVAASGELVVWLPSDVQAAIRASARAKQRRLIMLHLSLAVRSDRSLYNRCHSEDRAAGLLHK